ncbi:MAG: hypothetical protein JWN70_3614 [Planctomycetaceae bacterium]|nr:hypothetical protein [Planctomycetaceae bacterium]
MCRYWLLAGLLVSFGVNATWAEDAKVEVPAKEASAPKDDAGKPQAPTADTKPNNQPEKPVSATAEQLKQWTQDLVNPKFAIRQAASQRLVHSGKAGMEAVAGAAQTDDLELATRCLAVLTEGLSSKSEDVQLAARTALQNLAKSENKSVAQRARAALETPVKLGIPGGRFPGGVQGNFQQIAVQINNGARQIKVTENGKEIVIKDNNGKEITVTTTETVNGQKVTKSVTAKDEDDLKKNHAEAHTLFEKYSKGGNGIQLKFGMNAIGNGIAIGQPGIQAILNRPRAVNPFKAAEAFEEIDKLRQKLEESNEKLSKAAESDKPVPADLKAISAEIKALTKRLGEIKAELGQQ